MRGLDTQSWTLNLMIELDGQPIGSQSIWGAVATFRTVRPGRGSVVRSSAAGLVARCAGRPRLRLRWPGSAGRRAEAFTDNAASNAVSRSIGYVENGIEQFAPLGVPRDVQRFRMTAEAWRSRPRPPLAIEGLDGCLELFGAG
jgi:hypothetical protein